MTGAALSALDVAETPLTAMAGTPLTAMTETPRVAGTTGVPLVVGEFVDLFTSPSTLLSILIEGLAKASLYLMIASGLTLIFGLMDVINFAHGAFTMYGAYIAGGLVLALGVGAMSFTGSMLTFLVILVGVFALLALLGTVFEVALIRRLYEYPPIFMILLTFGIAITLEEFMRMIVEFQDVNNAQWRVDWATPRQETVPQVFRGTIDLGPVSLSTPLQDRLPEILHWTVEFGPLSFRGLHPLQIALGVVTLVGIWYFLNRTRYGLFVRAGVEDEEMAKALGINIKRTFTVVFAIGSGLAGAAGVMLMWSPLWAVNVPLALAVLLPAFVIVIVGGLGSFKGTVVASLLVGMIDAFASWAFQVGVVTFTDIDQLMIFGILVVMLILRPRGLFGVEGQGDHG